MRSIVATSLMIIFLIGGVSISAHIIDGYQYPILITTSFVLACIVGMIVGRKLINLIELNTVQKIFAAVVVGVAIYLIWSSIRLL